MNGPPEREATWEERATWGDCSCCKASHGEWCDPAAGFQFGTRANGEPFKRGEGVHLGRIERAPRRVRLVAVAG